MRFLTIVMWRFCSYYAFSINQVWKYWPLKDDHSISQKFYREVIWWWVGQNSSNFYEIFPLTAALLKITLSSLLLFSCACYYVHLDDIQWNEVATSTGRGFNNSWLLYLHFSNMVNLCPSIWFIENSKCQFLCWRKSRRKNKFSIFLKKYPS